MSELVNNIDVLDDDAITDSIIERTIECYESSTVTQIGGYAFAYCSKLTTLILRGETMPKLAATDSFDSTPIRSGTGYIYVPRALLSDDDATKDYRRATNWSNLANQFRALEDYTVDGTITGELDPTKI